MNENLIHVQKKVTDFTQLINGNPYIAGAFQDVVNSLNVLIDEKDAIIKQLEDKLNPAPAENGNEEK